MMKFDKSARDVFYNQSHDTIGKDLTVVVKDLIETSMVQRLSSSFVGTGEWLDLSDLETKSGVPASLGQAIGKQGRQAARQPGSQTARQP